MATLGTTVAGASFRTLNNTCRGHLLTTPAAIGAGSYSIFAYLSDSAAGANYRAAIVSASDYTTVLASSAIRTDISTAGWYEFSGGDFASYGLSNATAYVFSIASDSATTPYLYYQAPGATTARAAGSGITDIDPLTIPVAMGADATRDYSLYLNYTVSSTKRRRMAFMGMGR